jgi:hypothetical protein
MPVNELYCRCRLLVSVLFELQGVAAGRTRIAKKMTPPREKKPLVFCDGENKSVTRRMWCHKEEIATHLWHLIVDRTDDECLEESSDGYDRQCGQIVHLHAVTTLHGEADHHPAFDSGSGQVGSDSAGTENPDEVQPLTGN